jgi:hypothetical protein
MPAITRYAPRVEALARIVKSRSEQASGSGVLLYLPSFLSGDSNWIGSAFFEDGWYHRWHLRLLDLMAAWPGRQFVWKALPSSDQAVDPIPALIAERSLENVRYDDRHFHKVVSAGDSVMLDFPSTALYEAVHLGLPTAAVSFRRFAHLREDAAAMFAPQLRVCDTEDEAVRHFEEFLGDDPRAWLVDPHRLAVTGQ